MLVGWLIVYCLDHSSHRLVPMVNLSTSEVSYHRAHMQIMLCVYFVVSGSFL